MARSGPDLSINMTVKSGVEWSGAESKVNLLSCNLELHFLQSLKRNNVIYKEKENALLRTVGNI